VEDITYSVLLIDCREINLYPFSTLHRSTPKPLQRKNPGKNQVLSRLVSDPYYPASSSRKPKQRQEAERKKKKESHPISFDGPLTPRGCQKTRKRKKKKNKIERSMRTNKMRDGTYRVV
jgi:hypothetical protein